MFADIVGDPKVFSLAGPSQSRIEQKYWALEGLNRMASGTEKDQLIIQIAQPIVSSPRLDADWKSVSLVFTFEKDGLSNFGYSYLCGGQDSWKAFSTMSYELDGDVLRLRDVMKDESKVTWRQALFQLIRDSREMKFEFSYDNEMRWQITLRNLDQMVRGLQPH